MMLNINLKPQDGQWSESRLQVYYLQQIAEQMECITNTLMRQERTLGILQELRESKKITEIALDLMIYKREIVELFGDKEYMSLSFFRESLCTNRRAIRQWMDRKILIHAIAETDYLDIEPSGKGYRVKVIR